MKCHESGTDIIIESYQQSNVPVNSAWNNQYMTQCSSLYLISMVSGGGQEWVTRPGRSGGDQVTVYSPNSGQCLVVTPGGEVNMGICGNTDTSVWRLVSLD